MSHEACEEKLKRFSNGIYEYYEYEKVLGAHHPQLRFRESLRSGVNRQNFYDPYNHGEHKVTKTRRRTNSKCIKLNTFCGFVSSSSLWLF